MSSLKVNHGYWTEKIVSYIQQASGLTVQIQDSGKLLVTQKIDCKRLPLCPTQIDEILSRSDHRGSPFLQINFIDGKKILVTENLIGFKPICKSQYDLTKLPKVVTTRDLVSIFEVIEDTWENDRGSQEIDLLKRVFESVILGAEDVGFNLDHEKRWLLFLGQDTVTANA